MYKKIDHLGIAINDIEEAKRAYVLLGFEFKGMEVLEEQKVRVAMFTLGESKIELVEPLAHDSPIAKFIEKKGEGIHHIAVAVDDIDAELEKLKANGVQLIDEKPRMGAGRSRIAFLHPKSARGVLIELVERTA